MKTKYLLLTTLAFFALAVPVFASSSSFLSQAQKYINDKCSKKKIQDQTALLCYLFNKSQEQDTALTAINTTLSPIPTQIASLQASTSAINNSFNSLQNGFEKNLSKNSFYTVISQNFNLDPNSPGTYDYGCNLSGVAISCALSNNDSRFAIETCHFLSLDSRG